MYICDFWRWGRNDSRCLAGRLKGAGGSSSAGEALAGSNEEAGLKARALDFPLGGILVLLGGRMLIFRNSQDRRPLALVSLIG